MAAKKSKLAATNGKARTSAEPKAAIPALQGVNFYDLPSDVYIVYQLGNGDEPRNTMLDPVLFFSKQMSEARAFLAQFSQEESRHLAIAYHTEDVRG